MLDYIRQQMAQGASPERLKADLFAGGWQSSDIDEALRLASTPRPIGVPPQMPSAQVLGNIEAVPVKHHTTLKVILVFLIIVIMGAGAVFGYPYYQDYKNPPEKVLAEAFQNMSKIKSDSLSGLVTVVIDQNSIASSTVQLPFKKISISFDTSSDISDPQNIKGIADIGLDMEVVPKINAEFIYNGADKYLKIDNIPNLGFFDPSSVNGVWIKLDLADLQKQLGVSSAMISSSTIKSTELSPEKIAEIQQLTANAHMFAVTGKLPDEDVDGMNSYHYQITLDKDKLLSFIADVSKTIGGVAITDAQLTQERQAFQQIEFSPGEIWIGKGDMYIHKISFSFAVTPNGRSTPQITDSIVLSFKNFNQPVQVVPPTSFKTIKEVINAITDSLKKQNIAPKSVTQTPVSIKNTVGKYDAFARCLTARNAVLYGAFWCPHCQSQKAKFGESVKYLSSVECSTADGKGQLQICKDQNITAYPTWKFSDGTTQLGDVSLETLALKTGCTLPL